MNAKKPAKTARNTMFRMTSTPITKEFGPRVLPSFEEMSWIKPKSFKKASQKSLLRFFKIKRRTKRKCLDPPALNLSVSDKSSYEEKHPTNFNFFSKIFHPKKQSLKSKKNKIRKSATDQEASGFDSSCPTFEYCSRNVTMKRIKNNTDLFSDVDLDSIGKISNVPATNAFVSIDRQSSCNSLLASGIDDYCNIKTNGSISRSSSKEKNKDEQLKTSSRSADIFKKSPVAGNKSTCKNQLNQAHNYLQTSCDNSRNTNGSNSNLLFPNISSFTHTFGSTDRNEPSQNRHSLAFENAHQDNHITDTNNDRPNVSSPSFSCMFDDPDPSLRPNGDKHTYSDCANEHPVNTINKELLDRSNMSFSDLFDDKENYFNVFRNSLVCPTSNSNIIASETMGDKCHDHSKSGNAKDTIQSLKDALNNIFNKYDQETQKKKICSESTRKSISSSSISYTSAFSSNECRSRFPTEQFSIQEEARTTTRALSASNVFHDISQAECGFRSQRAMTSAPAINSSTSVSSENHARFELFSSNEMSENVKRVQSHRVQSYEGTSTFFENKATSPHSSGTTSTEELNFKKPGYRKCKEKSKDKSLRTTKKVESKRVRENYFITTRSHTRFEKTVIYPSTSTPFDSPETDSRPALPLFPCMSPVIEESSNFFPQFNYGGERNMSPVSRTYGKSTKRRTTSREESLWSSFAGSNSDYTCASILVQNSLSTTEAKPTRVMDSAENCTKEVGVSFFETPPSTFSHTSDKMARIVKSGRKSTSRSCLESNISEKTYRASREARSCKKRNTQDETRLFLSGDHFEEVSLWTFCTE